MRPSGPTIRIQHVPKIDSRLLSNLILSFDEVNLVVSEVGGKPLPVNRWEKGSPRARHMMRGMDAMLNLVHVIREKKYPKRKIENFSWTRLDSISLEPGVQNTSGTDIYRHIIGL